MKVYVVWKSPRPTLELIFKEKKTAEYYASLDKDYFVTTEIVITTEVAIQCVKSCLEHLKCT